MPDIEGVVMCPVCPRGVMEFVVKIDGTTDEILNSHTKLIQTYLIHLLGEHFGELTRQRWSLVGIDTRKLPEPFRVN